MSELAPVAPRERVAVLDVLRGLAMLFVLLGNLYVIYSWRFTLPGPEPEGAFDVVGEWFMNLVVEGRGQTLLTFLFGFGFAAQMLRAEARGEPVLPLYARRLAALFVIGWCHVLLLWFGDVTWGYAVVGVPLLLFLRTTTTTRLIWAAALILVPSIAMAAIPGSWDAVRSFVLPRSFDAYAKELVAASAAGQHLALAPHNAMMAFAWPAAAAIQYPCWLLGRFVLGLVAGAQRWFERDGADHLPMFRRMLVIGALGALPSLVVQILGGLHVVNLWTVPGGPILVTALREIGTVAQVAFYIAGVVLLMQRAGWRRVLAILAPVGRMPLTTYLMQSLVCTFLFYGWGLDWATPPKGQTVALGFAIFAGQVVFSHLYFRRFQFGPAEWVWRLAVYGRPP